VSWTVEVAGDLKNGRVNALFRSAARRAGRNRIELLAGDVAAGASVNALIRRAHRGRIG